MTDTPTTDEQLITEEATTGIDEGSPKDAQVSKEDTAVSDEQPSDPSDSEVSSKEEPKEPEGEELDEKLFTLDEKKEETPKVSDEQRQADRDRVREAKINKVLNRMQSAYTGGGDVQSSLDEEGEYWVRKEAEKRWNASLKEDKPAPDLDPKDMDERISAMVDERLARQTDDREFKFTVAQFKKENKLPKEANERLAGEWKELVSLGMSKTKAFEKATQIIGVAFEKDIADAEVRGAQRANMATPSASPSNSKPEPSLNDMDPSEMSGDDFLKWGNAQAKESIKSRVSSK